MVNGPSKLDREANKFLREHDAAMSVIKRSAKEVLVDPTWTESTGVRHEAYPDQPVQDAYFDDSTSRITAVELIVERVLGKFRPEVAQAFWLMSGNGMSSKATAKVMETDTRNVRRWNDKAKAALKEVFETEEWARSLVGIKETPKPKSDSKLPKFGDSNG